jgi:hypothetical protein
MAHPPVTTLFPASGYPVRSFCGLAFIALISSFCLPAYAGTISVNGTCQVGNCTKPDTLLLTGSISEPFNFVYTLANGDMFQIQEVLAAADTAGTTFTSSGSRLTATYLGNGSGLPSGSDTLTIDLLQNLQYAGNGSATFQFSLYGGFSGPIAASGSSGSRDLLINGKALSPLGPFALQNVISASTNGTNISGLTNPLLLQSRYALSFGAGSGPGAEIILSVDPVFQAPAITKGGVVPIFSSSDAIQPGSWVSIYGNALAGPTNVWNGNFPTSLGGVSVTIDSKPAYLWLVSATQINLQVPDDTATGTVNVVVKTLGGTSTSTATIAPYSPSFSLLNAKYPAAIVARHIRPRQ